MLSLSRALGRRLFSSAAASESAAAASTSAVMKAQNPLEEFFEVERTMEDDKPPPHYGIPCPCLSDSRFVLVCRSWKASELRLKSWDDIQKLWYVLLKEKNMLMSQRQMLHSENLRFPNPERISKVKKSMCRIKHVLTERAIAEPDPRRCADMRRMISAM
ncbi:hypothetical protein PR202_gb27960 [Eleusine coracana subsp. coracana]|uniref:Large ribosomal subunit protein uL29m n=1 Tax=Eleusine coracana subsp. coracana TaxID=191504 RepID=A0AAV5FXI1_ELECO|nr:hypothetical protein PR202_gb27960 [Eleusine coracana subsp. coracana]